MYTQLASDADTAALIAEIEALKATVAVEPLTIPDGCTGAAATPEAVELEAGDDPSVLNGSYQLEWTADELVEASGGEITERDARINAGVFVLTFEDGTFDQVFERTVPRQLPRHLHGDGESGHDGRVVGHRRVGVRRRLPRGPAGRRCVPGDRRRAAAHRLRALGHTGRHVVERLVPQQADDEDRVLGLSPSLARPSRSATDRRSNGSHAISDVQLYVRYRVAVERGTLPTGPTVHHGLDSVAEGIGVGPADHR